MFRRMKSRRGLSPVITTIFLMAIIIAAIGVSLGIILPSVQNLNDQLDLETNASNLMVIDENFRDMMLNGYTTKLFYTMDLGASGFFMGDISSTTSIQLRVQEVDPATSTVTADYRMTELPGSPTFINETQHRLIIRQELSNDILDTNSHQYLTGSGTQNMFYLNSIQRASVGWTILNQKSKQI
jgi:flagellin-like protein